jgi:DNA-binding winged helix-turn-helix (wHTH) protein
LNERIRQPVYLFAGFRLDAQRRVLFGADGEPLTLTPRLFDTLLYFVERAGQLLTKEHLLEALWPNTVVEEHNLNKIVSELRRVLGERPGEHRFIVTKPGRGYRFVADVSVASNPAGGQEAPRSDNDARPNATELAAAFPLNAPAATPRATSPRAYWVAAALGAGAIVIGAALFGFLGPKADPPLRTSPWSMEKGGQWSPRWSPDGEIAFVARGSVNEPAQIYIRALGEPAPRLIGRGPLPVPAIAQWAAAGKILFWQRNGLWSISPVGAPPQHSVELDVPGLGMGAPMMSADVTRDGAKMATVARGEDGVFGIWTATPPSAKLERYEPAPFAAHTYYNAPFLRFSPDGSQLLLFWYAGDRGEEAWLMPFPPDPSNPPRRILERLPALVETPTFSWLPDNRHIVVSTGPELQHRLYLADTLSGKFRPLTTGPGDQTNPVVSPDGSKLVLTDVRRDFDIVTLDSVAHGGARQGRTAIDTPRPGAPSD